MNEKLKKKKVEEIANFIINNITLAETTTMVMEKALESANYIVENNLDPNDFKSPIARKKLAEKVRIHKGRVQLVEEEKWYDNILFKLGIKKNKKTEQKEVPIRELKTRKNK